MTWREIRSRPVRRLLVAGLYYVIATGHKAGHRAAIQFWTLKVKPDRTATLTCKDANAVRNK